MGDKRHGERNGAGESNWIFFLLPVVGRSTTGRQAKDSTIQDNNLNAWPRFDEGTSRSPIASQAKKCLFVSAILPKIAAVPIYPIPPQVGHIWQSDETNFGWGAIILLSLVLFPHITVPRCCLHEMNIFSKSFIFSFKKIYPFGFPAENDLTGFVIFPL